MAKMDRTVFFSFTRLHAAQRAICVVTLKFVKKLIENNLTRRQTFDLGIESTHGQPSSCWAMPMTLDNDPQDIIRWIHGLGRGREVARGALRSSLKPEK